MGTEQALALLGALVGLVGVLVGIMLTFRASRLARERDRAMLQEQTRRAQQLGLPLIIDEFSSWEKTAEVRRADGSTVELEFDPDDADSVREFLRNVRQVRGDRVVAVH